MSMLLAKSCNCEYCGVPLESGETYGVDDDLCIDCCPEEEMEE